jgi:transcriptional regulator with XRE-family HTH domain
MADRDAGEDSRRKDNIVRAIRKVLGMTRVVFAEKAGLSQEILNDVERRRPVSKKTADAVTGELAEGLRSKFALGLSQVLDLSSFFDPLSDGKGYVAKPEASHRELRIEAVDKFLGSPQRRK